MQVFGLPGHIIRGGRALSRLLAAETPDIVAARRREAVLRWRGAMAHGLTSEQAARAVGVPRATLYRWETRAQAYSRRPHRVRRPAWSRSLVRAVLELREDNPQWGKRKLGPVLRKQGWWVSDATAGRILTELMRRGTVPPASAFTRPKTATGKPRRPHAKRLRGRLKADRAGQAVQLDTLKVGLGHGEQVKQFTAVDAASRWCVAMPAHRITAAAAARFLDKVLAGMPFPVTAIQIDGGSEFMAEFEQACAEKDLPLYVLPPRSPEMNGRVERMHATWRYEFYAVYDPPHQIHELHPLIDAFAERYNVHRPHDALDQRSPLEYLSRQASETLPPTTAESHMS